MSYDSYRPAPERRASEKRPAQKRDGDNSMFWRREQPSERRRHVSEEIPEADGNRPTPLPEFSKTARKRSLSVSLTGMVSDRSERIPPERSSTILTTTSPSNHQARGNDTNHVSTKDLPDTSKTFDPRLRNQAVSTIITRESVSSPIHSPRDEASGGMAFGLLIKALASLVAERNEVKRELNKLSSQQKKAEEDLSVALKMFQGDNPYIERLKRDLKNVQSTYKEKKNQLEGLTRKEEATLQAVSTKQNKSESLAADLLEVKKNLQEEESQIRQLRTFKDDTQHQFEKFQDQAQTLENQLKQLDTNMRADMQRDILAASKAFLSRDSDAKAVQSQVQEHDEKLNQLQKNLTAVQSDEIELLRKELKEQKLAIARVNDLFATNDALKDITTRLDSIDQKLDSHSTSGSQVTQSQLNGYVAVFNTFENNVKDRLRSLEDGNNSHEPNREILASVNDLEMRLRVLEGEQTTRKELTDRLNQLSTHHNSIVERNAKLNMDLGAIQQLTSTLSQRLQTLERTQQHIQTKLSSVDGAQLQRDLDVVRLGVHRVEQASKANTHAIDSLNQRFNNLTSDQLARQMIGIIEPMLTEIKPKVEEMGTQLTQLRSTQADLQTKQDAYLGSLRKIETQVSYATNELESLNSANKSLTSRSLEMQADILGLSTDTIKKSAYEEHVDDVRKQISEIRRLNAVNKDEIQDQIQSKCELIESDMIKKIEAQSSLMETSISVDLQTLKDEQYSKHAKLIEQVTEAKDSIEARVAIVEKKILANDSDKGMPCQPDTEPTSKTPMIAVNKASAGKTTPSATSSRSSSNSSAKVGKAPSHVALGDRESPSKTVTMQKPNLMQTSPLIKYFRSQSDDELGDTIDATPQPMVKPTKTTGPVQFIEIEDSDQDADGPEIDRATSPQPAHSSQELEIDLQKWQKPVQVLNKTSKKPSNDNSKNKSSSSAKKPEDNGTPSNLKRKRELPKTFSQDSSASSRSTSTTSPLTKRQRKKLEKLERRHQANQDNDNQHNIGSSSAAK